MRKMLLERGFTDKLYWYNFRAVWVFTACCFILNAVSGFLNIGELAIITYGVPVAFTELGIHTGFIVWKAKAENSRKYPDNPDKIMQESEEKL